MTERPTPKQALLIWRLLTAETAQEREPTISQARPKLDPRKERRPLVDAGFVALEKRGRAQHYTLTDKAWAWAASDDGITLLKSASPVGAQALQGLLRRLVPFLRRNDLALADLFSPSAAEASNCESASLDVNDEIRAACLRLAEGRSRARVRLSALRSALPAVPRADLDKALVELQDGGRLVLYRDDNTAALTEDDHAAALLVGGAPRHLVYWEG